jgi:pyrimidine deaminase RibD-like protein
MTHPDDGKFVVVQGGQRVSGQLHEKQDTAKAEAEALQKKRPVVEAGQGAPAPEAPKVVQNLYG